jgi:hypothetical protein
VTKLDKELTLCESMMDQIITEATPEAAADIAALELATVRQKEILSLRSDFLTETIDGLEWIASVSKITR